jgi:hypothetical protein
MNIDPRSIMLALIAVGMLFVVGAAGYDMGRRNLVMDIDSYGCEKVIAWYHGTGRK